MLFRSLVFLASAICLSCCKSVDSQRVISTSANEFVVGFMRNYVKPSNYRYSLLRLNNTYLFVTTDEPESITVTITFDGKETVHTISPRGAELISAGTLQLPTGARVQGDWDRNKGIRVKADGSNHFSLQCFSEEIHSVEGYTALPCVHLPSVAEYVYYAVSVPRSSTDHSESYRAPHSMFLIVACEDNTIVTLTPTQRIENPFERGLFVEPGQNMTATINTLETLQIEHLEDLTGSRIVTNAPVTFVSGHECGNVPYNIRECDHLVEQFPPTATWGKEFMVTSSSARTVGDIVMIMSSKENTDFNISCGVGMSINSGRITKAGSTVNFTIEIESPYCYIQADEPVLVVQFTPGRYAESLSSGTGDPFMLLVPPTNQYLNKVVFSSAQGFDYTALVFQNYLNLFVPEPPDIFNSSSISVNGKEVMNWSKVYCLTDVCGYTARESTPEQQAIVVAHSNPEGKVGVTSYGISFLETYAYIGGMKITLSEGPYIVEPEQTSFVVLHHTSLCLSCDLSHSLDAPDILWEFNKRNLITDYNLEILDNGTLCINAVTSRNGGNYTCHAGEHMLMYQVSTTIGIVVKDPVCLPTSNENMLIGIGVSKTEYIDLDTSAIEICCPTQGEEENMQWYADNVKVSNSTKYVIGSNFLRVSGEFVDGCVTYTCRADFSSKTISQSTEVCAGRVSPPSNVTIEGPVEVMEGQTFTFTCSASGFPSPEITWSRFGELLTSMAEQHSNGILIVTGLGGDNTDPEFCCDVGNTQGTRSKCISLTVLVPPKIQQPPSITNIITTNQATLPKIPLPISPLSEFPALGPWIAHAGQIILIHVSLSVRIDCEIRKGSPQPDISWWSGQERLQNSSKIEIYGNGSLLIKNADKDVDGVYTCIAETSGLPSDQINTTISTIVSPEIERAPPPYHSPGSCKDATKNDTVHQQVGLDVCVQAKNTTQIYMSCDIAKGVPKPNITWYKDHQKISSRNTNLTFFENGTILIEGPLVPIEAKVSHQVDYSGLYTCVVVNIAGITNSSSYILPFGGVSPDVLAYHIRPIHVALYKDLHSTIAEQFEELSSGEQHLTLSTNGRILQYDDYYPGRNFDGSMDTISYDVMEKNFKLTDIIPKGNLIVTDLSNAKSLSETYEFLVRQLRVVPMNVGPNEMQEARLYLQEKVEDLGSTDSNSTRPRLSLYIQYKTKYYEKKLSIDNQIEAQKNFLSGYYFSEWFDRHSSLLNGQVENAYIQWVMYGYKDEVEKWLKLLQLQDTGSSPLDYNESLEEAKALLIASKERSKFKEDSVYRPVKLVPDYWFRILKNRVEESVEQLLYHIANLRSQKEVLEVSVNYLQEEEKRLEFCNRPSIQFPIPISCPKDPLDDPSSAVNQLNHVRYFLEHEVERSEMFRYRCLVTRKPSDCDLYSLEHDAVLHLMDTYADLYFTVQLVTAARDHKDTSSFVIFYTIDSLEKRIQFLESLVQAQLLKTADRKKKEEIDVFRAFKNPMNFDFRSDSIQDNTDSTLSLPKAIRNQLLWHFEYSSFRSNYHADDSNEEYKLIVDYLNSLYTNVTADLVNVDIKRRWQKPLLFDNKHLQLINHSILVSPGVTYPPEKFRDSLANETYLFPIYPSSMLLATNIKLSLHTPFPYFILPPLLRMSYDRHLHGGFGPFVFGPNFKSATGSMKFSVSVRDSNVIISLSGTQLIGYVCNIVPQHPKEPSGTRRSKRFVKDDFYGEELRDSSNRFKQWLSLRNKDEDSKLDAKFTLEKEGAIIPSSTLSTYSLGEVETYDNSSIDLRGFKTDTVN